MSIGQAVQEERENPYDVALENFDIAAQHLELEDDVAAMIKYPERALIVNVPVRTDDGHIKRFQGYRVQHNTARGPAKGGIRFHCNAGGVTVSYFEWVQDEQHLFWEAQDIFNRLERVMKASFEDVLKIHRDRKVSMRIAANMLGVGRVAEAIRLRGLYP